MGIFFRKFAIVLFGSLVFVTPVFAQTYYWTSGGLAYYSISSLCNAIGAQTYNGHPNQALHSATVTMVDATTARCQLKYTWTDGTPGVYMGSNPAMFRQGDSCAAGFGPYDPLTGTCPAVVVTPPLNNGDKCADQTGATAQNPYIWQTSTSTCVKFFDANSEASCKYMFNTFSNEPKAYEVTGVITAGVPTAPPTFSGNSMECTAQTISSSECTVNVSGQASCNVMATFTGGVNAGGTVDAADDACPDDSCPVKEPKTETIDEGCNPVSNGAGGSTCTQTKETSVEGEQQCGSVNGTYTCIAKPPASSSVTTGITATTETEPDGDVKVTTVKNSALTTCTDINTCTTTHSVTTSHTTTKPSGSTSTTSSCTGSCTSSGGGVETIPGVGTTAGTGTGTGTCTGDECGEGEEQGTADIAQDCTAVPACDGDPFQCAILKQAHIDTCKLMAGPTSEQSAAQDAKINAEYAALDAHQEALDDSVTTLLGGFQSATSGGGSGGGQCLPDIPFSVMGHAQTIEFSRACEPLSFVRLVLLAGAYLIAARIVSREV